MYTDQQTRVYKVDYLVLGTLSSYLIYSIHRYMLSL